MRYKEFFAGKKITLMGLGLLGRGVGDAEFLAQCGAHVLATDLKPPAELLSSVDYLKKYPNIAFRLGEHRTEDFTSCDMVIKAAGVPLDSPYVQAAREKGIPVHMSGALFAKFASEMGVTLVGVTGTRGKSTITHMMYHTLLHAKRRAVIGGNVRGHSTLAKITEVQSGDIAVLELDSWQLQGFGDLKISPNIAIFSNLMPDHMNYYPDMQTYFLDKANIFRYQKKDDCLFVSPSVAQLVVDVRPPSQPRTPLPLPSHWRLAVPGEHNRDNASFAAAALHAVGLSETDIQTGLETFAGIDGRLQFIGEHNGVKIYNDNNATTPAATAVALRALGDVKRNIVLILGGDEKWLDMSELLAELPKWCSKVVLFKERGTNRIRDDVFKMAERGIEIFEEDGLPATVARAFTVAKSGEIILYSPAFSSFGKYFKNEFDRSDQFVKLIRERL